MKRPGYYATIPNNLPSTHQLPKTRCDGTWFTGLWLLIDCQIDNAMRWRQPYRSVRATAPKCAIPTSRSAGLSDHIHIRTAPLITFSGPRRRGRGLNMCFAIEIGWQWTCGGEPTAPHVHTAAPARRVRIAGHLIPLTWILTTPRHDPLHRLHSLSHFLPTEEPHRPRLPRGNVGWWINHTHIKKNK